MSAPDPQPADNPISRRWLRRARWAPELLCCRSDDERQELTGRFSALSPVILWLIWLIPLATLTIVGDLVIPAWMHRFWFRFLLFNLAIVAIGLMFLYLRIRPFRRFLRHQLHARGVPICLHCGYNLTGNVTAVCPECGTPAAPAQPPVPPQRCQS